MDRVAFATTQALQLFGDRWFVAVLHQLLHGPLRNGELRRRVPGISQRMLTRTLAAMEKEGFVTRTVLCEKPLAVEYALTELGQSLPEALGPVADWALGHTRVPN
jgi:DNA-binding HxlR family transcriptional regulator